jgi:acylphosphatase
MPKPQSIGNLLLKFDIDKKKYISREWQDYAYRLALALDDSKNKSLYMKLAKTTKREWLEEAKNFVTDANNVKSKARLFMWKLSELKKSGGKKQKPTEFKRLKVIIEGQVQGVGFRYWLKIKADELRLKGYVLNLLDGSVEAAFEGPEEKVAALLSECQEGPPLAKVKRVTPVTESWQGDRNFAIIKG